MIDGKGLDNRGAGIYHRLAAPFNGRIQYMHDVNGDFAVYYDGGQFVVGEKPWSPIEPANLFLRARNKRVNCPFPPDGWRFKVENRDSWVVRKDVNVKCYVKVIPSHTTVLV